MPDATLADLIARLEKAQGPDRLVDIAIWGLVGDAQPAALPIPSYTASLDAALTLVPHGKEWEMYGGVQPVALIYYAGSRYVDGRAATPALALCIAALRAREVTQ